MLGCIPVCAPKAEELGTGACPDSSLSTLLQVRTSARGRSTACGPPTSAHGKPGWTLCHTLTKVTFTSRLLKGHSMTPGAGGEEEGEGSFLPCLFYLFIFNLLPVPEKIYLVFALVLPPLLTCTGTSFSKRYTISSPFTGFNGWLLDFLLFIHIVLSAVW